MNMAVLDVDCLETCFGPAVSAFEIIDTIRLSSAVNLKTEILAEPRETRSETCYQTCSLPKTAS